MATTPETKKDTIYIDVDDEITAIIEKLQQSPQKIVALVLPKRATVLQSVVNMKLLKRSAERASKHIVLITSEAGLLPLAGAVGMHVASSLQSRPVVPPAPGALASTGATTLADGDAAEIDEFDSASLADQPIGALAGTDALEPETAAAGSSSPSMGFGSGGFNEPETIELDNADAPAITATGPAAAAAVAKAGKPLKPGKGKDKSLKIPNFNKFRTVLIIAVVAIIVLIGGAIYANTVLPAATITLKTNSTDIATKAVVILDPSATEFDPASETLPAKIVSKQQTGSQQVSTTGQKNNGTKASGSVTLSLSDCSQDSVTIPSGTGVSSGGKTFITQSSASMQSVVKGGKCNNASSPSDTTAKISVVAQTAGASYNISASKFTVAGFSNVSGQSDDPFTGGTDNIVKTVTQTDIDSAKAKIASADSSSLKSDLTQNLKTAGYSAITASLHAGDAVVTPSAAVGDQADTVTVTSATTYTMYGVKADDVKTLINLNVKKQIDSTKQQILKDGVSSATYQISSAVSSGALQANFSASSLAGPDIKADTLTTQFAGKKTGDVQSIAKAIPGVTDVTVAYSPFWVQAVPKKTAKITIVVEKADSTSTTITSQAP